MKQKDGEIQLKPQGIIYMRDNEGKKGFFTLFNNWLTRLLINLNPPAQKMAYAPVRIKQQDQLKRNI